MVSEADGLNNSELPEYKRNWINLRHQTPSYVLWGWKDTLDSIAVCWRGYSDSTPESMIALSQALLLEHIPELEKKEATEYLGHTKELWKDFVNGVSLIAKGEKLKWSAVKELAGTADSLINGSQEDNQAIALLQAIHVTHKPRRTPETIRRLIAQHTFDEIFNTAQYQVYEYTASDDGDIEARTIQDSRTEELDELTNALHSDVWDSKELKIRRKIYSSWKRIALSEDNAVDEEVADMLEKLWGAINGEGIVRTSALALLQLGEDIYDGLSDGEAFDVDLNDYEDDEEE